MVCLGLEACASCARSIEANPNRRVAPKAHSGRRRNRQRQLACDFALDKQGRTAHCMDAGYVQRKLKAQDGKPRNTKELAQRERERGCVCVLLQTMRHSSPLAGLEIPGGGKSRTKASTQASALALAEQGLNLPRSATLL